MTALPRLTRRGVLVGLGGLLLVAVGAGTGFTDVVRAGLFALALVVIAWLLVAVFARRRLDVERRGPGERLQAGREATVRLRARTGGSRRWFDARVVEPHTFGRSGEIAADLDAVERGLEYPVTPPHRGAFTSGPTRLEERDALGLTRAVTEHGPASRWLVWPALEAWEHTAARVQADGDDTVVSAHAHHAGRPGASIRPYVRGDDLRTVHWAATAHRGELMVRQFDPPAEPRTHLVLAGHVPEPGSDAGWEWLVRAAAAACVDLSDRGIPLLADIGGDEAETREEILDLLAAAGDCRDVPAATSDLPTRLFVHPSFDAVLPPPRHAEAVAYVAGDDARARRALATRLAERGWRAHVADADLAVADVVARGDHDAFDEGERR